MLKPHNLIVSAFNISDKELIAPDDVPANNDDDTPAGNIKYLMDEGYRQDKLPRKVLKALLEGKPESKLLVLLKMHVMYALYAS